ncbi:MAG: tetratricopeptide repeat protein [Pseudomonadota bacterium]
MFDRICLRLLPLALAVSAPALASATPDQDPGELSCRAIPDHAFEAAHSGNLHAQTQLGRMLVDGYCGNGANAFWAGVGFLEAASEEGHGDAAAIVAVLFDDGVAIQPDRPRALAHYRRAAHAGHLVAQHRLGMLLISGEGGETNTDMGLYWLGKAASQGDGIAAAALGLMHARGMYGVREDACLARDWYEASELMEAPIPLEDLREELRESDIQDC